jgi:hypothetical protein
MCAAKSTLLNWALKEAGTENAVHAIVDVLKEVAKALDALEASGKATAEPKEPWDYSTGIVFLGND